MQRADERAPSLANLEVYQKNLQLCEHACSVCKPRDKKPNNHHIPKRFVRLGDELMSLCVDIGADIIEANEVYVGRNIPEDELIENYKDRLKLQYKAKRKTYRIEHISRVLHYQVEFADSTITYLIQLIYEQRQLLIAWYEADKARYRSIIKS